MQPNSALMASIAAVCGALLSFGSARGESFYSLNRERHPDPIRLVRFDPNSDHPQPVVVGEIEGMLTNPTDAHMDVSPAGRLYVSPQNNTVYAVDPCGATIVQSVTLDSEPGDIISGIAVSDAGLVYVSQDLDPGGRLWMVDFDTEEALPFLSGSFEIDDIDFDDEGRLIGADLNNSGNVYRIPLDGSPPELLSTLPQVDAPVMTFRPSDSSFYLKATSAVDHGRGLYRLPWSDGLPDGPIEFIGTIGEGEYAGLAATPVPTLEFNPPDGAIDARQPTSLDGVETYGWQFIDVASNGPELELVATDFAVMQEGGGMPPPDVLFVLPKNENNVTLLLSAPINVGAWTTITHLCSGSSTRLGYLPGDVNGDATSRPLDILSLIDALNGVGNPRPLWATDIDRSTQANPADIIRLIDLLNGADAFEVWHGATLP